MSNPNGPQGLQYIGTLSGASTGAKTIKAYVPSAYGTALYNGDPVVYTGTANAAVVSSGLEVHDIGTLQTVAKATAGDGNKISGIIISFEPIVRSGTAPYNPASTERVCNICIDPDALYEIQADSTVAATDVSSNANVIYTVAGSTSTGLSGVQLDTSSMTTTATYQLKIIGLSHNKRRNDVTSANPLIVVKVNNSTQGNVTAGI